MNKPIAWIDKNTGKPKMDGFIQTDHDIPLYTHPVKQLSDEEIHKEFLELVKECDPTLSIASVGFPDLIADFARAIIKEITE